MESNAVISESRDEIRLGRITIRYAFDRFQVVVRATYGEDEVIPQGGQCSPEVWESFVKDLESKLACGPLLSALRQIRSLADDADRNEGQGSYAQLGLKTKQIARQVLDEFERTTPEPEDTRHISMLEAGSSPRGIAPEEIVAALNYEAARMNAQVTPLNWQVTKFGDDRIVYILYSFHDESLLRARTWIAIHVNDKPLLSHEIEPKEGLGADLRKLTMVKLGSPRGSYSPDDSRIRDAHLVIDHSGVVIKDRGGQAGRTATATEIKNSTEISP